MTGSERTYPATITIRLPKGREAEFARDVAASGLTRNAYVNQALFRGRNKVERAMLAKLLWQAQQIRDELHEARLAGGGGNALGYEGMERALEEIRAGVMALMGRRR